MIDRVQAYIQSVLSGETMGDPTVGRYLLETLSAATDGLETQKLESLFNNHLQVGLSYLRPPELAPDFVSRTHL